jgi:hypothetical protein
MVDGALKRTKEYRRGEKLSRIKGALSAVSRRPGSARFAENREPEKPCPGPEVHLILGELSS